MDYQASMVAGGRTSSSISTLASTFTCLASTKKFRDVNSSSVSFSNEKRSLVCCSAKKKKKISFVDRILDYIEGGPKLRKWYGAPDLLPKDDDNGNEQDDYTDIEEERDAILVTDGDSDIGQMVILSLIVKKNRVKALVNNKKSASEAFGTYVESLAGDTSDKKFLKRALRGVRTIICPNEGFISSVGSLTGVQHVIFLSQLSVYRSNSGITAVMKGNAKKLAEQDELTLKTLGIPYTIIRTGALQDTPGGVQGFSFEKGCAGTGTLSKEDAAFVCVQALEAIPQQGFLFEVTNGDEKVSAWKECLTRLMEKADQEQQ